MKLYILLAATLIMACRAPRGPGHPEGTSANRDQTVAAETEAEPTTAPAAETLSEPEPEGAATPEPTAPPAAMPVTPPLHRDLEIPPNAVRTSSGLTYLVLRAGTGTEHPTPASRITVQYTGWSADGQVIDGSVERGRPFTFVLNQVIKGWVEGIQLMVVGEKRRLWIPAELAYDGMPGRPQGMLVFDIELIEFVAPPDTPMDVAAPPKHARRTPSGLASRVLAKGKGRRHPRATSKVKVHYTGWTTDGRMFDSSVVRGQPATFPLDRVIAGWTEGLQLMVEGEQRRFWIPAQLAYDNKPGRPQGMLVFDVELIEIVER